MKEYCGNHFILNGEIRTTGTFDNSLVYKGDSIYEVIRTRGGKPVFFDDHMERLNESLRLQNKIPVADPSLIKRDILQLTGKEKRKEINIKVVFNYNEASGNYLIYYVDSVYPTPEQYKRGIRTILFYAERKDPHSKVFNYRMRSEIHQQLSGEGASEALLVNENNLITEGSKSNVFFLKNNILVTAPDEVVLKGITRKYVIEICNAVGSEIKYECVNAEDLGSYEAVFITGTSPMVLPVCCINDKYFSTGNLLMSELRNLYLQKVEESLRNF